MFYVINDFYEASNDFSKLRQKQLSVAEFKMNFKHSKMLFGMNMKAEIENKTTTNRTLAKMLYTNDQDSMKMSECSRVCRQSLL
jgi:hypothetical protein